MSASHHIRNMKKDGCGRRVVEKVDVKGTYLAMKTMAGPFAIAKAAALVWAPRRRDERLSSSCRRMHAVEEPAMAECLVVVLANGAPAVL